ncbi:MAG: complex I subunit 5 family protein [Brotaphodocola sp.]
MNQYNLALPVFLPLIAGILLLIWNQTGKKKQWSSLVEWCVEGIVLCNSVLVFLLVKEVSSSSESLENGLVLYRLFGNLTVMFKLDRMGCLFAALVAFLWPLATLYSFEYMEGEKRRASFFAFYTMTYGVTLGIAMAGNLVTLYIFYEMLTLVTFPLVLFPLTREAVHASRKYLYYSIGGAAFAFIGLIFVLNFSATGTSEFAAGGILDPQKIQGNEWVLQLVYVLAFFGFGVKAALFPCHGWLPRASVAPTPVTALLHAVAVVKSGAFAILRLTYFSYGISFLRGTWAQTIVMTAALVTIVYGSTMAVREVHWKRRLAYSTISNLSYILFGAAMMTPLGIVASLSHLTAHAFMKICSFFCAGAVMHKADKHYVYELDGLGKRMPITFACLTAASFSLMGIPLFAGFISKWNLAQAAFAMIGDGKTDIAFLTWLPLIGVMVILYSALMTGIYMLTVLIRAWFPKKDEQPDSEKIHDPSWKMLLPLCIFVVIILAIGLHSKPLMDYLMNIGGEVG